MEIFIVGLVLAVACGFFAKEVTKGDETLAFMLGLLLGPIGVLISVFLGRGEK